LHKCKNLPGRFNEAGGAYLPSFLKNLNLPFIEVGNIFTPRYKMYIMRSRKLEQKIIFAIAIAFFKTFLYNKIVFVKRGVAQMVAHVVWDHGAAGSSPVTPTI
jgi:hypothetical protein